jgi:peroxiredoxin
MKMEVMARYFPDASTSKLTEFLRGELQLTAAVSQIVSQVGNVIDVNIKSDQVGVWFAQAFPQQPVSPEDEAAINLLIRNALKTGFLPSSSPVPASIDYLQFKALPGNPNALVVLLNMASFDPATGRHEDPLNPGDPATVGLNFLGSRDDWAFAASADFILSKIQFQPIPNQSVPFYHLSFQLPTVEFQPNRIVLKIKGHAEGSSTFSPPGFDFTVTQAFKLRLVSTIGGPFNTAELVVDGDVSIDPGFVGWLVDLFKGGEIKQQRDDNLAQAQPKVRDALDIKNLGGFINALLQPPDQTPGSPPPQEVQPALAYTSWAISPAGIVLTGSLSVPDWPAVHVEFQQIPQSTGGRPGIVNTGIIPRSPDYSALNSWIPGGTIQQYEWGHQGQPQPFIDPNRFVLLGGGPEANPGFARVGPSGSAIGVGGLPATIGPTPAYTPICLTLRGVRYSASGLAVPQPVSGSGCGVTTVPVVQGVEVVPGGGLAVALTQPGPNGLVEVVGHTLAQAANGNGNSWNRIVHFSDYSTVNSLQLLLDALNQSKRTDAATVVIGVLTPDQLPKARYTAGVIYAEEQTGEWAKAFGVKTSQRPFTLIAGARRGVEWEEQGPLDSRHLAGVFAKYLFHTSAVAQDVLALSVKIGRPAPNLLVPLASGALTTLGKMAGRPIILHFCASWSKASLQSAQDLQKSVSKGAGQGPILLIILDGDTQASAKKVCGDYGLTATVVPDAQGTVSRAYGVSVWPTTVFLDAAGAVRSIRYGRFTADVGTTPYASN